MKRDVGALDLDAAAQEIEARRDTWAAAGVDVGQITWRETAAGWPYSIVLRSEAIEPDSLAVFCRKGEIEFQVVLYDGLNQVETGGWADVEGYDAGTGNVQLSGPQVPDIVAFGKLLDDAFAYWFAKDRSATP